MIAADVLGLNEIAALGPTDLDGAAPAGAMPALAIGGWVADHEARC